MDGGLEKVPEKRKKVPSLPRRIEDAGEYLITSSHIPYSTPHF